MTIPSLPDSSSLPDPPTAPLLNTPNPFSVDAGFDDTYVREVVNHEPIAMNPGLPPGVAPDRSGSVMALGISSLVIGLFGCACCPFIIPLQLGLSIPAILMARSDFQAMAENRMDSRGRSNTQAGMICAIIGLVLALLSLIHVAMAIIFNIGAIWFPQ
jgi:hypothetical protein